MVKPPFQFNLRSAIVFTLLAGLLLGIIVNLATRPQRPRRFSTMSMIKSIELACQAYEFDWSQFPPDTGPAGQKSSSALIYYLTQSFRLKPLTKVDVWATQDAGPYLDVPARFLGKDATGHAVILDAWGQPIEYDNIRDDKSTPNGFTSCGPDDVRSDGKPRNRTGVDIFSRGEPNTHLPLGNFEMEK